MKLPRFSVAAFTITAALLVAGCASYFDTGSAKSQESSSVVAFLYPGKSNPTPPTAIPVLRLPLRVGIAFVPSTERKYYRAGEALSESAKAALMRRVAEEFKGRDYIESIQLVPTMYLQAGGGFENLDQVRRMLNVDVIALLAYDQVQFTNESFLSLAYWTVVGAYFVQGNKNDTHTMMDAAVFDIASRHMLFRAGGVGRVQASSAAVYVQQNLREDSAKSFELATAELIKNLQIQLLEFRERLRQNPTEIKVERRPGYTGSGDFGAGFTVALLLLGGAAWARRRF